MEDSVTDRLILNSRNQLKWASKFEKSRYLLNQLAEIDEEYYIGIKGVRGVGKTVLMLQHARKKEDSIYFSADSSLIRQYSLYETSTEVIKRGYRNIFIDEVHRKPGWDADIKTLYDEHEARVVFSGSSALDITRTSADLSRRVVLKELRPTSFREYLNIRKDYDIPPISLEEIIKNKTVLTKKYAETIEHVNEYMKYGGVLYPKKGFMEALENSIKKIILQDLSALRDINIKYETDAYKLLHMVSNSPPYETNYSAISSKLEISKTMAVRLVSDLEKTGVVIPVFPCKKRGVNVKKEPKIYLTIPLREFFAEKTDKGAAREEFLVNHLRDLCYLKGERGEKTPDFRYKDTTIEVGGESKTRIQNPDIIATDSLTTNNNKIPLILFGLTY